MSRHYPRRLQKLASQLADSVSLMLGYVGHHGTAERHHPVLERVSAAYQAFQSALIAYEDAKPAKPKGWRRQLKEAEPVSHMIPKRRRAELLRAWRTVVRKPGKR